jgi:nitrogen fixation/metabolism regulation signal transduction histidine kinase
MAKRLRGTGVKHTIGFVGRFSGLWMVVTIAAVLVAAASTYLVFAERFEGATQVRFVRALALQTGLTVVAVVALAIFTTHRLAGPWIAVRRALEAVRDGNLDTRLRIRASDINCKNVEVAFNEMVEALNGKRPAGSATTTSAAASPATGSSPATA